MSLRVAVYDSKPYDHATLVEASGANPPEWVFHGFRLEPATAAAAAGCQAVCLFVNDHADAETLKVLAEQGVQHIALRCAGFNNVNLEVAKELGIRVTRVPAYSPHAVAEHTLALLLTLNRRIHRSYNRVRELNFSLDGLVGFDLHGKTAGVIGTGRIGAITAEIFRGFGMKVLAFDPFPQEDWAAANGIQYTEQEEVISSSDVLSLHVPLTPQTHHLMNEVSIARMKPGAILLNVSRGGLVDTTALIQGLKSGQVGGVGLDVYEEEEGIFFEDLSGGVLHDDELARLLTFPNVLITSHQAFLTREALDEIGRVTVQNLWRLSTGEPPLTGTEVIEE